MATEDSVRALFGKLDTQLRNQQPKRALKTVEEILKAAPADEDALRCKALVLIELENFESALLVISTPALEKSLGFEKAYCQYRLGRLQDALATLRSVTAPDKAVARLQLEAQLHYRLGAPQEAIRCYSELFQREGVEGMEVRTNVLAAYLAGGKAAEVPAVMEAMKMSAQGSFEVAFNVACALIETGSLSEAEKQLQLAQRIGEEALYEEELGDEEVALELAPVAAQLAYVAARLGRSTEASASYKSLLALPLDDEATAAVANSNLCALALEEAGPGGSRKVAAESLRKLEPMLERAGGTAKLKKGLDSRLGSAQKEALLSNYAALALMAGKADAAKDAIRGLEKASPSAPRLPLLQAAQLSADKKVAEADAVLAAAAAGGSMAAGLMRVQLAASTPNGTQQALELLQSLPGVQSKPGVVATEASLLQQAGQGRQAVALLSQALSQQTPGGTAAAWILSRLATLEQKEGDLRAAVVHLQQLLKASPPGSGGAADAELLPRYALMAALCNPAAARALTAQLPKAPALAPKEVDALENANVAIMAGGRRRGGDTETAVPVPASQKKRGAEGEEAAKQKKRRKRRKRLPKGYDPENPPPPPDPERWLPKWQRSDAKKKHKKKHRGQEAIKGSQGAGKVDESLDRTHATEEVEMADASKPKLPPKPAGAKGKKGGKGRR